MGAQDPAFFHSFFDMDAPARRAVHPPSEDQSGSGLKSGVCIIISSDEQRA